MSDKCEDTSQNGKLNAILLIICVNSVAKYSFFHSGSVQLYAKHTRIFVNYNIKGLRKEQNQTSSTK